ncbi:MAG: ornithine cyclodeaminase family protein [bacterium]
MGRVLILNDEAVEQVLTLPGVLTAVSEAFEALSARKARLLPTVRERVSDSSYFGLRSAIEPSRQLLGLKASVFAPANVTRGLESHQASILLLRPEDGRVVAIVAGNSVTRMRTAASSVVATRLLARSDGRRVLIVGTGAQAEAHVVALDWALSDRLPMFWAHAPRGNQGRQKTEVLVQRLAKKGVRIQSAFDLPRAAMEADIIVTATASRRAILAASWLRPGTHVNAVGSDAPGKRELDDDLIMRARIFVDDAGQAAAFGECQWLAGTGSDEVTAIGDVLRGVRVGRTSEQEVTVFDSTGLAMHDVATAELARVKAIEAGIGEWVDM